MNSEKQINNDKLDPPNGNGSTIENQNPANSKSGMLQTSQEVIKSGQLSMYALDKRNSKVFAQTLVFGKPIVYIRTSPAPAAIAGNKSTEVQADQDRVATLLNEQAVQNQMTEYRKILVTLKDEEDDEDNEYRRTKVNQHAVFTIGSDEDTAQAGKVSHNLNENLQIIELVDSTVHEGSYHNQMKAKNPKKMAQSM